MPLFTIIPLNSDDPTARVLTYDEGSVFSIVAHFDCEEADVLKEGLYSYSVRLDENGVWAIFHRGQKLQKIGSAA